MAKKILVVDDEESIVTLVQFHLQKEGYTVIAASDGPIALHLAQEERPDLIVLDLMLPGMDGLDVCRELRQKQFNMPIVMLTAKDDEFDKVLGLELGADDYLTKPFSPRELVARVKAVLRRSKSAEQMEQDDHDSPITIAELKVFPDEYKAYFRGEEMELTPKEFELLLFLSRNKKRVLSRDQLLSAVWDYDFAGDTRIVDVHISHLREKLEDNTKKPVYIKTIRGFGYKMEVPK
ncbi:DNA-binding response regulator [Pullulanibacillus camelliae]|uniref:DNA-binding response regulator n=1 Tax=Pullulanibacillus camelliae TaxID=1707096 RepID=A0A8J2YG78_9BACL|nr:response regulator transcription factor [Pullulanibacillus camelliae]GGE37221.1 DNA-binding response regulator [Pullulanibacillus camelliae]